MFREREAGSLPGTLMLLLLTVTVILSAAGVVGAARAGWGLYGWVSTFALLASTVSYLGLFVVNPNEAKVVLLFGSYQGTAKRPGFHWVNPFTIRQRVSLRIRNFESARLKVNDHVGNPIEIASVVVWRVVETRGSDVRGGRLQELRPGADRSRRCETSRPRTRTMPTSTARSRCAATPTRSPSSSSARSTSGSRRPASR